MESSRVLPTRDSSLYTGTTTESSSRFIFIFLRQIFPQGFLPGANGMTQRLHRLRQVKAGIGRTLRGPEHIFAQDRNNFAGVQPKLFLDFLGESMPGNMALIGEMIKAGLRFLFEELESELGQIARVGGPPYLIANHLKPCLGFQKPGDLIDEII